MPQLLGAELHIDLSEVLSTLITYPYNIISGAAAVGTVLLLLRRWEYTTDVYVWLGSTH